MNIPECLSEKAAQFPESSYGANKVRLKLLDGSEIEEVILAWGKEIIRIGNKQIENKRDLPFSINQIVDVESEI